jgi:hypothetical protein
MKLQNTIKTRTLEAYRGINKFKKSYEPRPELIEEENGDLFLGHHNV